MADGDSCPQCGCTCETCVNPVSAQLQQEIVSLNQRLVDRDKHIEQMESSVFLAAQKFPTGEVASLHDEIAQWQEKYERLFESHKKLQRVNQGLEDKLLKIVDKYETEKSALNRDVKNLTTRLVQARVAVAELEEENEQYRNDCNLAVQLLQCKPSNFISHKVDTLPADLQQKVKHHMNQRRRDQMVAPPVPDVKTIRVPISTFPPTAMVYSVNRMPCDGDGLKQAPPVDMVSASIMAKVLEERTKERIRRKNSDCACGNVGSKAVIGIHMGGSAPILNKCTQTDSCDGSRCGDAYVCQCSSRQHAVVHKSDSNRTRSSTSSSTETEI